MNYYIRFDNNFYNIVDGDKNQVIASFVSYFEANKFIQSLFGFTLNPFTRNQSQAINQYPINNQIGIHQNPLIMQINTQDQYPLMKPKMIQYSPLMQQSQLVQQPPMAQQPQPIQEQSIQPQSMNENLNLIQDNKIEEEFKFEFNDNNLSIDSSLFQEDKMGAIIKEPTNFINNTDDDSLGEVSAYRDIKHKKVEEIKNEEPKVEMIENTTYGLDDLPNLDDKISFEEPVTNINAEDKAITEIYEENLIPKNRVTAKKDDGIIDLGPMNEDDEIFSTPRKDAEQDDFEVFHLSKKEKAELKKAKKREELSRKKYKKF